MEKKSSTIIKASHKFGGEAHTDLWALNVQREETMDEYLVCA
jgi:hypothetical protein